MNEDKNFETKDLEVGEIAWSQAIPNYGDKVLKRLNEFRKSSLLYDVCLRTNGGDFHAHKVILAACGGIFSTCFIDEKTKMMSGTINEIRLDCPAHGMRPIMKFAYTGSLTITNRNAIATMQAAEVTKMKEVLEISASIVAREYGWINLTDETTNANRLDELGRILQTHESCFPKQDTENVTVEGSSPLFESEVLKTFKQSQDHSEYPYCSVVTENFPDYLLTYKQLTEFVRKALSIGSQTIPNFGGKKRVGETNQTFDESNYNSEDISENSKEIPRLPRVGHKNDTTEEMKKTSATENKPTKQNKERIRTHSKKKAPPPPKQGLTPPPRPKPPVRKHSSMNLAKVIPNDDDDDDYDMSLNPFA